MVGEQDLENRDNKELPSFVQAVAGSLVVVLLLSLRPLFSIVIALPLGGLVCALSCKSIYKFKEYAEFGLSKVTGVSIS